ncbi:MAG TPA: ribosome recycling factor [Phycisphaerales bacterium]|nr:ribosome recycling factor [Phycisphaerales bacterium]
MKTPDAILNHAEEQMKKAIDYLNHEMLGLRGGRASTALVEYIKVNYYGTPTDMKSIASISTPESTQILIKPFDASAIKDIRHALEESDLGLNPQVDGKQIRLNIPPLSTERRKQLVAKAKKMAEEAKIVIRNARRESNKQADALGKGEHHISEDEVSTLHDEIQDLLKKYEAQVDTIITEKSKEIMSVD